MELQEDEDGPAPNVVYKAVHEAFRDRWKETDDTMCRHSMSFHLHHTLRSEFFASYLYLVEKIPLGRTLPPLTSDPVQVGLTGDVDDPSMRLPSVVNL